MAFAVHLRTAIAMLRLRALALAPASCPFCGPSLFVRLNEHDYGERCLRCRASGVHIALGLALREYVPDLGQRDVCELSARGPLVGYLRRRARSLATSEYFADVALGETRDGVRCEDVQKLTYADARFDLVTHTEVLEHVPDDHLAFVELFRVLRAGGIMVFTVPLLDAERTVERARLHNGDVEHLEPAVFHTDPLRQGAGILAFRDYGRDILERLRRAGFSGAHLHEARPDPRWWTTRKVIVAFKDRP